MTEAPLDTYIKSPPPADERSHFNYLEEQLTKLENVSKKHVVRIGDNNEAAKALVLQESEARVSGDEAQATYTETVAAQTLASATALVNTETTARTTADTALASSITTLNSTVGTLSSSITSEASTRATADTALGTRIDNLVLTNGSSAAVIIDEEATARIAADYALGVRIDSLTTTVNSNTSAISTEQTTRSTRDDALAKQLFTMSSGSSRIYVAATAPTSTGRQPGDVWFDSSTANSYKPYVWARSTPVATTGTYDWRDNSEGSFTNLVGNYAVYTQAISTLNTTTTSQASSITALQTTVGNSSSGIIHDLNAVTATVGDSTSGLVRDLNVLSTTVTNSNASLSASISSEATARASGDTALGSRIDTVSATVNGHTASIGTLQTVQANTSGALSAQWALVGSLGGPSNNIVSITGVRLADGTTLPYQVNFSNSNVTIDGNLVVSGSINGSKISNGAISSSLIASGAVGSSQIATGGVTTGNIAANSISYTGGSTSTSGTATVNLVGVPGSIVCILGTFDGAGAQSGNGTLEILVNGTVVNSVPIYGLSGNTPRFLGNFYVGGSYGDSYVYYGMPMWAFDSTGTLLNRTSQFNYVVPAGVTTLEITCRAKNSGGAIIGPTNVLAWELMR